MKQINKDKSVLEPLENKSSKKANEVFLKLLAKQRKPKNPFDKIREYTPPSMKEIKPGVDSSDTN